jgi:hypothetical protein
MKRHRNFLASSIVPDIWSDTSVKRSYTVRIGQSMAALAAKRDASMSLARAADL